MRHGQRHPANHIGLIAFLFLVTLNSLVTLNGIAAAGPNANAKILLHLAARTTKLPCTVANARPSCGEIVTHGNLYPSAVYYAYVLVTDGDAAAGISGCKFGIQYTGPQIGAGVDIYEWHLCADTESKSTDWPASGSSNVITWFRFSPDHCQRFEPAGAGTGVVANAGYFYCAAYSPATFQITPHGAIPSVATVTDCAGQVDVVEGDNVVNNPSHLGALGFGNGQQGYNPCAPPCLLTAPGFVLKWGTQGSGSGQFNKCDDVACDANGTIYVADRLNSRIQKFDRYGYYLGGWGQSGSGIGQFINPTSVAVDNMGHVFVGDTGNNRIQRFDENGVFQLGWGSFGTADGQFDSPKAVATDASGNVYVADASNCRIQKFTSNGVFIRKWGTFGTASGQFNAPEDVEIGPGGQVYVADTYNHRIQEFTADGSYRRAFGSMGNGDGQFNLPTGVAVDGDDIYVSDYINCRIQKFDFDATHSTYNYLAQWGTQGVGDGQFQHAYSLAFDPGGAIYVADTDNHRIQKFACNMPLSTLSCPLTTAPGFVLKWGTQGSGSGQFNKCDDVACDANGTIYVTDRLNSRIQKFYRNGNYLGGWGQSGSGIGQFINPTSVAVDNMGHVFVGDTSNNRIQRFDENGVFQLMWGSSGTADGQFDSPKAVATDASGNVYVADASNCRIQKFTSNGVFIRKWGTFGTGSGQFNAPEDVEIGPGGQVYVADTYNHRIQEFNTDGLYQRSFGSMGTGNGQFNLPTGVAVDRDGKVYVSDYINCRIEKFDFDMSQLTYNYLAQWGRLGLGDGQFQYPYSLAADPDGAIYVADTDNHRIQEFACNLSASGIADGPPSIPSGTLLATPNPFFDRTVIPFTLPAALEANLTVLDLAGRRVRQVFTGRLDAGTHSFSWDGLDAHGNSAAAGIYFIQLQGTQVLMKTKVIRLR